MHTYTVVAFFLDDHSGQVEIVQAKTPRDAHLTKDDDRAYSIVAVFEGAIQPVLVGDWEARVRP